MSKKIVQTLLFLSGLGWQMSAFAWQHEIMVGYGYGSEVEQPYRNHGLVITGKIYRFNNIDDTLYLTMDGTIANIYATTHDHDHMAAFVLAAAGRAYFTNPLCDPHCIRPYLQASFGPAYLTNKQLGTRTQGSHWAFQTTIEAGVEMGTQMRSWDINLRLAHYCNAGIFHPNNAINLVPILSVGYLF